MPTLVTEVVNGEPYDYYHGDCGSRGEADAGWNVDRWMVRGETVKLPRYCITEQSRIAESTPAASHAV